MRVLHVINSLATGGAERLVVDLAVASRQRGHETRVLTINDSPGVPRQYAQDHEVDVVTAGLRLRDPRIIPRLRRESAAVDMVHVHLFPALYWAASLKTPKVFTEHSTWNRRMGDPRLRVVEGRVYSSYDAVAAISDGVKDALRKHLSHLADPPPIAVVPNGIRSEFFDKARVRKPREHERDPLNIVSVCSLTDVKNIHLAIRTLAVLPHATLRIAGEGPLRGELQALIDELGLRGKVRLLGAVADVPSLLASADLFLSTSRWEGFGLSIAEALATGLPVVGPRVSGVQEVVSEGDDGLLFAGDSVGAVADSIARIARSPSYSAMSRAAIRNSGRFSIDTCAAGYEELYNEVLG